MKNILIIIAILFSLYFSTKSQIVEERVNKYITLKSIDSSIIYSYYCSGYGFWDDSCKQEESQYLLWRQNNSFFIKKFDFCNDFKIVKIDSINPLTFYLNNKKKIEKENIKPPTHYVIKKIKGKIDTLMLSSTTSHSCFFTFSFFSKGKLVRKSVDTYDLSFKKFDDGHKNIYYKSNQKTKLKVLIDLTTKLIKQLEVENKFIPEKIE